MSGYAEKKIRDAIKAVFNMFEIVEDFIFTTYDFDPDFFEEHVITYLMGSDKKISTIGELNATNQWIKDHGMCVYYDKGALKTGSSCVTLPVYPQNIDTGVFHPKVIVIYGKLSKKDENAAYLIVSSCNLTVSGYGRNQEAFYCIRVSNVTVAESLLKFIETLSAGDDDRHAKVKKHLRGGRFKGSTDVEFIWSYQNRGNSLLQKLSELPSGDMQIISPYFDDEGPKALLDEIEGRENTRIIPAMDGETYNIHKSDYVNLKREGITFESLAVGNGDKRFTHAKVITKGNYVIVGSHNFTSAALKQKNAEASLMFRTDMVPEYPSYDIEEGRFLSDDEGIVNKDETEGSRNLSFVTVTVDWEQNEMLIFSELPDDGADYRLAIDGMKDYIGGAICCVKKRVLLDDMLTKTLLKHKQFSVYCNGIIYLKGLINEINWAGIRPEIGCETLDETIAEWFSYSDNKKSEHTYDLKLISEEDEITEKIIGGASDPKIDIFDNYYLVASALGNMHEKIRKYSEIAREECPVKRKTKSYYKWDAKVRNAEEELYKILVTAPGSIVQMLKFLDKSEQNKKDQRDVVYLWLIYKYLKVALKLMPEKLERIGLYVEKKETVRRDLKKTERKYRETILKSVSSEYLKWVEKELFIQKG